jgi:hypothetical protein
VFSFGSMELTTLSEDDPEMTPAAGGVRGDKAAWSRECARRLPLHDVTGALPAHRRKVRSSRSARAAGCGRGAGLRTGHSVTIGSSCRTILRMPLSPPALAWEGDPSAALPLRPRSVPRSPLPGCRGSDRRPAHLRLWRVAPRNRTRLVHDRAVHVVRTAEERPQILIHPAQAAENTGGRALRAAPMAGSRARKSRKLTQQSGAESTTSHRRVCGSRVPSPRCRVRFNSTPLSRQGRPGWYQALSGDLVQPSAAFSGCPITQ